MHVFEDLQAYVCTFKDCPNMLTTFPTRKLWELHETKQHLSDEYFRCLDCSAQFPSSEAFLQHLKSGHNIDVQNNVQTQSFLGAGKTLITRSLRDQSCPLCRHTGWDNKRAYFTHVGKHLEQVALSALPPHEDDDSDNDSAVSFTSPISTPSTPSRPLHPPQFYGNDVNPQIYTAVYSSVSVFEMEVNGVTVMRRRADSWLNATQILKVAGVDKTMRTKILENEVHTGEHEKVQGGYGKYQGTWINRQRGREFCRRYGVERLLLPLLEHGINSDGNAPNSQVQRNEKERKKDMQRKRRREQQIRNETQRLEEWEQLAREAREADDPEEHFKYLLQAKKSQARIRQMTELLERGGGGPIQDEADVSSFPPSYEGGMTTAFQVEPPAGLTTLLVGPKQPAEMSQVQMQQAQMRQQAQPILQRMNVQPSHQPSMMVDRLQAAQQDHLRNESPASNLREKSPFRQNSPFNPPAAVQRQQPADVEAKVLEQFPQFANLEKQRLIKIRKAQASQDHTVELNELRLFANSFKLKTPISRDMVEILAKDPKKQEAIIDKAQKEAQNDHEEARSGTASSSMVSSTAAVAARTPEAPLQTSPSIPDRQTINQGRGGYPSSSGQIKIQTSIPPQELMLDERDIDETCYSSSSYSPKLEANFMKDFSCCGLTLPNLHDLLQHYEEAHAHKEPEQPAATSFPSQGQHMDYSNPAYIFDAAIYEEAHVHKEPEQPAATSFPSQGQHIDHSNAAFIFDAAAIPGQQIQEMKSMPGQEG